MLSSKKKNNRTHTPNTWNPHNFRIPLLLTTLYSIYSYNITSLRFTTHLSSHLCCSYHSTSTPHPLFLGLILLLLWVLTLVFGAWMGLMHVSLRTYKMPPQFYPCPQLSVKTQYFTHFLIQSFYKEKQLNILKLYFNLG